MFYFFFLEKKSVFLSIFFPNKIQGDINRMCAPFHGYELLQLCVSISYAQTSISLKMHIVAQTVEMLL